MYDSSLKYKWDNENVKAYAIAEAEARGMEKGERLKAINIAREMKKDGAPKEQISKFTQLSIEEIEKL